MSEAILTFLTINGYFGVFLLMVFENIFPPIPSEVILPFIGHLVATGELSYIGAVLVATLGAVVGTSIWFVVGWLVGTQRLKIFFRNFGGYVAISERDFVTATTYFTRYKKAAVFFGRMIPAVRSVISIPAGCIRMKLSIFLIYSSLGALIWNIFLITLGYLVLDDYTLVDRYMANVADTIIYLFLAAYLIKVIHFTWRKHIKRPT